MMTLILSAVSMLGGGAVRVFMHWLDCRKAADDNQKDVAMARLDVERLKQQGFDPQKAVDTQVALNRSQIQLINAQADASSPITKWQRPILFLNILFWYDLHKAFVLIAGLKDKALTLKDVDALYWTSDDAALFSALCGYLLTDQTIKRMKNL